MTGRFPNETPGGGRQVRNGLILHSPRGKLGAMHATASTGHKGPRLSGVRCLSISTISRKDPLGRHSVYNYTQSLTGSLSVARPWLSRVVLCCISTATAAGPVSASAALVPELQGEIPWSFQKTERKLGFLEIHVTPTWLVLCVAKHAGGILNLREWELDIGV